MGELWTAERWQGLHREIMHVIHSTIAQTTNLYAVGFMERRVVSCIDFYICDVWLCVSCVVIHACGFMCVCVCGLYVCVFVYLWTFFVGMDSLASIAKDIVLEQHVYDRDLVSYSRSRALSLDHTEHHQCEHEMLSVYDSARSCACVCVLSHTHAPCLFSIFLPPSISSSLYFCLLQLPKPRPLPDKAKAQELEQNLLQTGIIKSMSSEGWRMCEVLR